MYICIYFLNFRERSTLRGAVIIMINGSKISSPDIAWWVWSSFHHTKQRCRNKSMNWNFATIDHYNFEPWYCLMSVVILWPYETALSQLNDELKFYYHWSLYMYICIYIPHISQLVSWRIMHKTKNNTTDIILLLPLLHYSDKQK